MQRFYRSLPGWSLVATGMLIKWLRKMLINMMYDVSQKGTYLLEGLPTTDHPCLWSPIMAKCEFCLKYFTQNLTRFAPFVVDRQVFPELNKHGLNVDKTPLQNSWCEQSRCKTYVYDKQQTWFEHKLDFLNKVEHLKTVTKVQLDKSGIDMGVTNKTCHYIN